MESNARKRRFESPYTEMIWLPVLIILWGGNTIVRSLRYTKEFDTGWFLSIAVGAVVMFLLGWIARDVIHKVRNRSSK